MAFLAGVVSFLSPCVLPIIPGFLAYLAGGSANMKEKSSRWGIFMSSFFFVLGFSIVFALIGVLFNGALRLVAYGVQIWLSRIGGLLIIFFGLYLMGFFKIAFLEFDHKIRVFGSFRSHYLTSLVFGFAFAAGWTPCVGPVLGAIFGLATASPGSAFYLLMAYALGMGIPFLIIGALAAQASDLIARYAYALEYVTKIFGSVLVILGILVFTQSLEIVANLGILNRFLLNK